MQTERMELRTAMLIALAALVVLLLLRAASV
jgi:hypothetical protein